VKAELRDSRVAKLTGPVLPSRGSLGQTPTTNVQLQLPSICEPKELYSVLVNSNIDKRFKLLVTSKLDISIEAIKNALKINVNLRL